MFRIVLAVGLLTGILCGPLPNPGTELLQDERFASIKPSSESTTHNPPEINPLENNSQPETEEKLEAQETFYPVGGVWWGVRPWGGWGGYRPWHGPHWGGWGGYRPWHRPHWGGHWGGHWNAGQWGRTSS